MVIKAKLKKIENGRAFLTTAENEEISMPESGLPDKIKIGENATIIITNEVNQDRDLAKIILNEILGND